MLFVLMLGFLAASYNLTIIDSQLCKWHYHSYIGMYIATCFEEASLSGMQF